MRALPSGTVTFMFTDIEGSTRLLQQDAQSYRDLLARHDSLIRDALASHGGVEVRSEGDAFFAAFPSARDALAAAIEVQRGISGLRPLKTRIGLHTGEATATEGDYLGQFAVHVAARVADAGNGDQILVSGATRDLVDGDAVDLGEHHLKDIDDPLRLYRVIHPDLVDDTRAPRTRASSVRLPVNLSSFIGRRAERDDVTASLGQHRLVTLTGAGGSGKTRLAIESARALAPAYDTVAFVDLSPITASAGVAGAVINALELQPPADVAPLDAAIDHLRERRALIVLDNCEQVLDAAGETVVGILSCEHVRVLATSREPLGLAGEVVRRIPSLGIPEDDSIESVTRSDAARLFTERARERDDSFELISQDASAIAQIVRRLDGIPLAIELAAARIGVLSPEEIAKRLDDRFGLLAAGGGRIERQRTLRAAIDWSHNLLDDAERSMLRRLSVFAGPFSMEGAERVSEMPDALDLIGSLVDKSLVITERTGPVRRFRMLETIRQYAAEKLADAEDPAPLRDRHADWFVELTARSFEGLRGPDIKRWLDDVETELDNVRAAIRWSSGRGRPDSAARIVTALRRFWVIRGYATEALQIASTLLGEAGVEGALRVRLLTTAAYAKRWAGWGGSGEAADDTLAKEALVLAREIGDDALIAAALFEKSWNVLGVGRSPDGAADGDEAVEHARRTSDPTLLAQCLIAAGMGHSDIDVELATRRFEEAISIARETGDVHYEMWAVAVAARIERDVQRRLARWDWVLTKGHAIDDRWIVPWVSLWYASSRGRLGFVQESVAEFQAAIELLLRAGQRLPAAAAELLLGSALQDTGRLEEARAIWLRRADRPASFGRDLARVHLAYTDYLASRFDQAEAAATALLSEEGLREELRSVPFYIQAHTALIRGEYERARERTLLIAHTPLGMVIDSIGLAYVEHLRGDAAAAWTQLRTSLEHARTSRAGWLELAEGVAFVLATTDPAAAGRLLGWARETRARRGTPLLPVEELRLLEDAVRADPSDAEQGAQMDEAEVIELIERLLD